jgi:hypothetical protein
MQIVEHSRSGNLIVGLSLAVGAILQPGDVYDSTQGIWEECPCPGVRLRATSTKWVRPRAILSENARVLLGYLNLRGDNRYNCIAQRGGRYYVIPSPNFNWDGRYELKHVQHPECIQELTDFGYLTIGEHPTSDWHADYSPANIDDANLVYTLTDLGKLEGAKILAQ